MRLRLALFALLPLAASSTALTAGCSAAPPRQMAADDRLVIMVSVDGLAAYYLEDPKAHMPTLRRMMREGAWSEGLHGSFPSVTWPNHTTLVTGVEPARHGVLGNTYWDRAQGKIVPLIPDPLFDKDEIVKTPTLYDVAHKAGLRTAGIIWPASRNAKTLDWTMPDVKPLDLFLKYSTPEWMKELREEGLWVDQQETWCNKAGGGVQRDWLYARATAQVIRKHRPNLVLLHLVELDHVQHADGPQSPNAYWACSYADDRIRDLVDAVEAAGLKDRTTFLIVSDHGFVAYTKQILPNVLLRKAAMLGLEGDKIVPGQAIVVAQGGGAFVYVLDRERRSEVLGKLRAMFKDVEGVSAVIDEREFAALGIATPAQDPRAPDLALSARDGYTFSDVAKGDAALVDVNPMKGSHGCLPSEPRMRGTFVAWGAGIKVGVKMPVFRSVDVAPTAARLLGLRLENVDGRPREEILK